MSDATIAAVAKVSGQPLLITAGDTDGVMVHELAMGTAVVFTASKPGREGPNEDALAILPVNDTSVVLAVADGLGGHAAGHVASRAAIEALAKTVLHVGDGELRPAIIDAIESVNRVLVGEGVGSSTTLAVVELNGRTMRPYHVGDSAIQVVGQRGRLRLLTVAHSPVGYAQAAGLIGEEAALRHHQRHIVSNVIGTNDMRIELGAPLELNPLDTVLLASDGLFDNLRVDEIANYIRTGPIEDRALELAALCRSRMHLPSEGHPSKPDDLTFILYRPRRG